jgi:hypothetical protein
MAQHGLMKGSLAPLGGTLLVPKDFRKKGPHQQNQEQEHEHKHNDD